MVIVDPQRLTCRSTGPKESRSTVAGPAAPATIPRPSARSCAECGYQGPQLRTPIRFNLIAYRNAARMRIEPITLATGGAYSQNQQRAEVTAKAMPNKGTAVQRRRKRQIAAVTLIMTGTK